MPNFPPKVLIGTTFSDRHAASIRPGINLSTLKNSRPLPLLTFNYNNISSIHTRQLFKPHYTAKEHDILGRTTTTTIEPFSQCLLPVTAPVHYIFTIENHPNLYQNRSCSLANGIREIYCNKSLPVWVVNLPNKEKKLPRQTVAGIFTTSTSVIYHQTTITEEVDHQEKESVNDKLLDIKTKHPITVDILATLKDMHIRDPSKLLSTAVDEQ